jgi:hypothetical protein
MSPRTAIERGSAQAGTRDDAGTPGRWTLLFALLGGAVAWSLHLLGSYVLLAYGCTREWGGTRPALATISVVALLVTIASGLVARRRGVIARERDRPVDDAWDARMGERTARVSFIMVVGLVLAIVFGLGIVYEAITVFLVPLCEAGAGA